MKKPLISKQINYSLCAAHCPLDDKCPLAGNGLNAQHQDVAHAQREPLTFVGIPTIDGMEFLKVEEIIRCEGLRRLTKLHLEGRAIISSYNIGEFGKLLGPCGFFAPHKSHLINLQYLRSYHVDGTIILRDGACVPLARRRKEAFLRRVRHL